MRPSPIQVPAVTARHRGYTFAKAGTAFRVEADTIQIFDAIGHAGITATAFTSKLNALGGKPVRIEINSPGGDVFDGLAIFNALARYPGAVDVSIVGLAASAASIIAMAGDKIEIAANAFLMIHKAWALTIGNADEHTATAGILNKIDGSLSETYANRTGRSLATVRNWMQQETWFSADEAKQNGFVDAIIGESEPQARFDLSVFRNCPAELQASLPPEPKSLPTRSQVERYLRQRFPARAAHRISNLEWPTREGRQSIAAKLESNLAALRSIRG